MQVAFTFGPQEGYSLFAGTFQSKSFYIVSYILTKLDNYVNPTGIVAVCTETHLAALFVQLSPALAQLQLTISTTAVH